MAFKHGLSQVWFWLIMLSWNIGGLCWSQNSVKGHESSESNSYNNNLKDLRDCSKYETEE